VPTHSPSWLAWSEGWQPLGAQSVCIHQITLLLMLCIITNLLYLGT